MSVRAIKRINHNAAICTDASGRQLIALGRGIGFGVLPRDIDLADVTRTFYGIDPKYLAFIDEADPEVLEFAAQLSDVATQQVSYELSPNLPITLADHIQFALQRARQHIVISLPLDDVQQTHPVEFRLGELAVRGIRKTFGVRLPASEAAGIAMSIVNAMASPSERARERSQREDELIELAIRHIEAMAVNRVDRNSFACTRLVTHIRYLLHRIETHEPLQTQNSGMYEPLAQEYPQAAACARAIGADIESRLDSELSHEELVYLMLHINRVIA